ncbi:MAG: TlpA family protein disulfide reductase [Pseudomonadota bacterium]|nr:TlpA family protein disulfide reductase [Pseudomonadota bacterium]
MSLPSTIAPLLLLGLLAGCDKQVSPAGQATPTPAASRAAAAPLPAGAIDRSHKGETMQAASFFDASGKPTTLAAFKGKPVLLNLWATWCGPCVTEMPALDKLAAGMAVVAVSQDLGADGQKAAATFLLTKGLRGIRLFTDPNAGLSTAYAAALPTTILYDSTGHEVWRTTGGTDWGAPAMKPLIAEAR